MAEIAVCRADYMHAAHRDAVVALLDAYASDPVGGAAPLCEFARTRLADELAKRPWAFSVLAFDGALAVGLVNCFEGFSTFACRPLVNVHDVVVAQGYRGRRIVRQMFAMVEEIARERGACKLTLEVLTGNVSAIRAYEREGFSRYQLDPGFGSATFMHKKL